MEGLGGMMMKKNKKTEKNKKFRKGFIFTTDAFFALGMIIVAITAVYVLSSQDLSGINLGNEFVKDKVMDQTQTALYQGMEASDAGFRENPDNAYSVNYCDYYFVYNKNFANELIEERFCYGE